MSATAGRILVVDDNSPDGTGAIADRLAAVQEQVAAAARSARRDPADVTTIVVTKFQPLALIEALHALGVRDFGESRHPEARDKAAALPDAGKTDAPNRERRDE